MSKKYKVSVSFSAKRMMMQHLEFLSRVSTPAARRLRNEYSAIVSRMKENPLQFPLETDDSLPNPMCRRAFFGGRYKVLFFVDKDHIYIDAIQDCRQDNTNWTQH